MLRELYHYLGAREVGASVGAGVGASVGAGVGADVGAICESFLLRYFIEYEGQIVLPHSIPLSST